MPWVVCSLLGLITCAQSHKEHHCGILGQVLIPGVREPRTITEKREKRHRMDKNESKPFFNGIYTNSYQNPSIMFSIIIKSLKRHRGKEKKWLPSPPQIFMKLKVSNYLDCNRQTQTNLSKNWNLLEGLLTAGNRVILLTIVSDTTKDICLISCLGFSLCHIMLLDQLSPRSREQ